MTLSEFLLARIAEDEVDARSAHWRDAGFEDDSPIRAFWLAECEAKRRIVGLHGTELVRTDGLDGDGMGVNATVCRVCEWVDFPCETLRLLALPYADHPGYRDEWKP